ncbi:MAG: hypothetical protein IT372_00530 [Polyangiaceae bacterium]|nr:hypothetical protein [Polyangiaceae bacterium]
MPSTPSPFRPLVLALLAGAAACSPAGPQAEPPAVVDVGPSPGPGLAAPDAPAAAVTAPGKGACPAPPPLKRGAAPLGPPLASGSSNIMGPYFSAGFGFYPVDGAPPPPRAAGDAPVELALTGPATLAAGKPISLSLHFMNRGQAKVTVVRPLDGTLEQWRSPMYDLYARDDASGTVYRFAFTGGRCGNVNPIKDDDYVTLAPGASRGDVADNGWAQYLKQAVLTQPGRYSVWVVYSFCGFEGGGVPLGQDVVRQETHVGVHASNAVRITVQ